MPAPCLYLKGFSFLDKDYYSRRVEKSNVQERSALNKFSKDGQESRRTEQLSNASHNVHAANLQL